MTIEVKYDIQQASYIAICNGKTVLLASETLVEAKEEAQQIEWEYVS